MNSKRLMELDALRGLAALSVVFYHYYYRYDQIYGHSDVEINWSVWGQYGVHLFFMVSGFVIFWTLENSKRPLDFLVSRFSRLYPTYWVAIVITFLTVYTFGLPGREVSIISALANTIMIHEYLRIPHVDGVYWTLTVELTFYFWMFLLYCSSRLNKVEGFFLVLIFMSTLHSIEIISIPVPIYKIFILKYVPFFLVGISFYKLYVGYNTTKSIIIIILSILSTLFIYSTKEFLLFVFFCIIFYLSIFGYLKVLKYKFLVSLGGMSYSLYLVHQNIGYVIINKSYQLHVSPALGILAAVVVSIIIALILREYVENPSLRKLRCLYMDNERLQKFANVFNFSCKSD